jgi:hypothetical protein
MEINNNEELLEFLENILDIICAGSYNKCRHKCVHILLHKDAEKYIIIQKR